VDGHLYPIYLTREIGFSIGETALMFSIMLLPFIIFQIPVGKIADKKLGEKEMLLLGLIIMGTSTIVLSLLESKEFIVWAALLLLTRVGASLVEITTESYFFKHVNKTNTDMVSLFRMTRPLAYIITAGLATVMLQYMSYTSMFFVFGILILVLGLRYTLPLHDTK
jgi:MFS family permease